MLKINGEKFKLKEKDFQYKIEGNQKDMDINIITYIGVFNERMDDIKINITCKNIKERKLSDLKEVNVFFNTVTNTWEDNGVGKITFKNIVKNKLEVEINLTGEYNYEINTVLEASWLTLNCDLDYEKIDDYIDINEIEEIPFITETEEKRLIQYMFTK